MTVGGASVPPHTPFYLLPQACQARPRRLILYGSSGTGLGPSRSNTGRGHGMWVQPSVYASTHADFNVVFLKG